MDVMGGGFLLMLLFPLVTIALAVLVASAISRDGRMWSRDCSSPGPAPYGSGANPAFSSKNCPHCRRPLQADWQVCPYDGTRIE